MEKILVTGGAGFVGSHTCVVLLQAGYQVVVLDSLINSSVEALRRVESLACRPVAFVQGDVRDSNILRYVFEKHKISAVMHFAGLKSVSESVEKPIDYYSTNLSGTISLCQAMQYAAVFTLIFSSSCTVYGNPIRVPVSEDHPTGNATNPYGRSKYMVERALQDLADAIPDWKIASLRYFNPIGAHESGLIGEDSKGIPTNLVPYICNVASGKLPQLQVFGGSYPTRDGTGIRDYVHVVDVAEAHLAALRALKKGVTENLKIWNLGTGIGYSVLDLVREFEVVTGHTVPYRIAPRRSGDVSETYADAMRARIELGWVAKRDLKAMLRDAWNWQSKNLNGFQKVVEHRPKSSRLRS